MTTRTRKPYGLALTSEQIAALRAAGERTCTGICTEQTYYRALAGARVHPAIATGLVRAVETAANDTEPRHAA